MIKSSTKSDPFEDLVSQAEAARIRGVSNQAIADLIRRGRLHTVVVAGRAFVYRSQIEAFEAKPKTGRPPKNATKKRSAKKASRKARS